MYVQGVSVQGVSVQGEGSLSGRLPVRLRAGNAFLLVNKFTSVASF